MEEFGIKMEVVAMTKIEAIEILKTQSCTDCYSADDAYHCPDGGCPVREATHIAIEALESTRWIPVSERLPKQDKYVFVYLFGDSPYIAWHDGIDWCTDEFVLDTDEEPLEWMSLPKRYRGESDDEV